MEERNKLRKEIAMLKTNIAIAMTEGYVGEATHLAAECVRAELALIELTRKAKEDALVRLSKPA